MGKVNITIDGIDMKVPEDYSVLEAAREVGVDIPTLCYLKDINEIGACRMCLVEIKQARGLQASCVYPVSEGLDIITNSESIRKARKATLELILSNHDRSCLTCNRNNSCELQALSDRLNVRELRYEGEKTLYPLDLKSHSIVRDNNKCILCRRCISMCKNIQTVSVIDTTERGFYSNISSPFDLSLNDVPCISCGQCINVCPVNALREKDDTELVWDAINDKSKHVVVQTAPATRVAIGEEFGLPIGTRCTKNMVGALRRIGFDKVFDTDTGADLTIMEEGTELLHRLNNGGKLPMITSCSPGWVTFCEYNFPEFLDNLSTCKSPMQMFGAVLKTYYAKKTNINPADIIVVAVMPCIAKKAESKRPEMSVNGLADVDHVITTRELAKMIKEAGIDFHTISSDHYDDPMGDASGAGVIFGATGGVMEAAIRTVYEIVTKKPLDNLDIISVRGIKGIKEANVQIGDFTLKAAVASGTGNARKLLEMVKSGEKDYHFIEIMACPGGCVNGGGQPIQSSAVRSKYDLREERAKAIYAEDVKLSVRKSHENKLVQKLYKEFLGEPGGHKSHELLHTHYIDREKYPISQ
ncbi:MAG: [FeFe] hydrogenase, group A [Clostridiales bacterium]|nr:[FeFe] hydrogenase, group A [Clostridiales bacterium]